MDFIFPLDSSFQAKHPEHRAVFCPYGSLFKYKAIRDIKIEANINAYTMKIEERGPFDFLVADYVKNCERVVEF